MLPSVVELLPNQVIILLITSLSSETRAIQHTTPTCTSVCDCPSAEPQRVDQEGDPQHCRLWEVLQRPHHLPVCPGDLGDRAQPGEDRCPGRSSLSPSPSGASSPHRVADLVVRPAGSGPLRAAPPSRCTVALFLDRTYLCTNFTASTSCCTYLKQAHGFFLCIYVTQLVFIVWA